MRGSMLLLALLSSPAWAEGAVGGVGAFLEAYSAAAPAERAGLAQGFLAERAGAFPIVDEGGAVTFVYLGPGEDVRLVGDFAIPRLTTRWDPTGVAMRRVAQDGQLWVREMELPEDARVLYRVVVDGEAMADPLNPRTLDDPIRGGPVSELAMPAYPAPVQAAPITDDEEIARGRLVVLDEPWADPKVTIYLPPGYAERDPDRRYPTLYTADGSGWIDFIRLPTILDRMIADGSIEPLIAVMIDAKHDRTAWYWYNPEYLAYLERVIDAVDGRYATRPGPASRIHAGTSRGGAAALYAALERPDLFGAVATLSGHFGGPPFFWEPFFSGRRAISPRLRAWMSAGTFEGYIVEDLESVSAWLRRSGAEVETEHSREAHNMGTWRHMAPRMLTWHFAPD